MMANQRKEIDKVVSLLYSAREGLKSCIDYETANQEYAIASLLLHILETVEEALKLFDRGYYERKKKEHQAQRLIEKGV